MGHELLNELYMTDISFLENTITISHKNNFFRQLNTEVSILI